MAERTRYVLGADVPDGEVLRDSKGRVVDDAYVESAVEDAVGKARTRRSLAPPRPPARAERSGCAAR